MRHPYRSSPTLIPLPTPDSDSSNLRRWLYSGILLALLSLIAYIVWETRRPRLIHYIVNDHSASAQPLNAQRQQHCQASLEHYRSGDRRIEIAYADRPETIHDQTISNTFLFNPCQTAIAPIAIGNQDGTSVIRAFEQIAQQVSQIRLNTPDQRVAVTLTLQYAEIVGDQPALDESGYETLRQSITQITGDNQGTIAIIGPGGALQNDLQRELQNLPNLRICPFAATESCVTWALTTPR